MDSSLTHAHDLNNVELLTVSVENLADVKMRVGELAGNLSSFLTTTNFFPTKGQAVESKAFKKIIKNNSYADLRQEVVYRPTHMVDGASFMQFVNAVLSAYDDLKSVEKRVLTPYHLWLGTVLNDASNLEKLADLTKYKFVDIKEMKKDLLEVVDPNNNQPTDRFENLFGNLRELDTAASKIEAVVDELQAKRLTDITEQVADVARLVQRLSVLMKEKPEEYNINRSGLKVLNQVTYNLAVEIEAYGTIVAYIQQAAAALNNTADRLK